MDDAKWYVVHTYSGYENKVKANIEKTVENRNLHDQILEVIVPLETVVEIKDGSKKAAQKKMFPGYVLVKMVMNDDSWYVVRNTWGVTGFVGPKYVYGVPGNRYFDSSGKPTNGATTGCHLHLGFRINGEYKNPLDFF